jgi:hypothetical protein
MIAAGDNPADKMEDLIKYGVHVLGFKNKSAARSCIIANVKKVAS